MAFEQLYSEAYDSLNAEKNYESEVVFVMNLYNKHKTSPIKNILDLGCGSGLHLQYLIPLLNGVNKIVAVDSSEFLCKKSRDRLGDKVEVVQEEISKIALECKFNLVLSLFHVINYQTKEEDLIAFLYSIKKHLQSDGLAIVDFWNLSAWRRSAPISRVKTVTSGGYQFTRTSTPDTDYLNGTTCLSMKIVKQDSKTGKILETSQETHTVRAFTIFEIQIACTLAGLKVQHHGKWMDINSELDADDWYGFAVLSHSGSG